MGVPAGPWHIDDLLTFTVVTHKVDTGVLTDADSVPSYRVYEDETGTAILSGSMAKLDDANTTGFYSEQLTLSAANGFENGKSYAIYVSATVNSVVGGQTFNFKVDVPDVNAVQWLGTAIAAADTNGYPKVTVKDGTGQGEILTTSGRADVNVDRWNGTAVPAPTVAGIPSVEVIDISALELAAIADAVWDEDLTGHTTVDTAGKQLDYAADTAFQIDQKTQNLPSDPADQSLLIDAANSILAAIAALNNLSAAQVNAEVLDVLNADTFGEPAQGTPGATATLVYKLGMLYKALINKSEVTASEHSIYNAAGAVVDHKRAVSDVAGTFTSDVLSTGP